MICSALYRIMPADMIVHGSKVAERNRVGAFEVDWTHYAEGKDDAINAAFDSNLSNPGSAYYSGCYEMGWSAEERDFATMRRWARDLPAALLDRKNGTVA